MTGFAGRQREKQFLRLALEGRESKLLIVCGPSGVGKTALIEQVLNEVMQTSPILGRAKYAEQAVSTGLRPVVDALSQAVDALVSRLRRKLSELDNGNLIVTAPGFGYRLAVPPEDM